jgi:carboxyl-terminal processing protease
MSSLDNASPPLGNMRRIRRGWWIAAALFLSMAVALFSAGFLLGHFGIPGRAPVTAGTPGEHTRQFYIFWEAWHRIEQQFYPAVPLDPQAMTFGAIEGMLASLGDPFTSFARPSERRLETDTFQGDFGGIGASLALMDGQLTLVEVYVGSPAEVVGLQAGDRLLAVDGTEVTALPLDQVVLLIRGSVGTVVLLDVQRGSGKRLSLSIVRQRVELPSLSWQLLSDGIGYVGIHLFSARTGEELARAIQELRGQKADALVVDLRGNGGGLTGGAIDVLRRLLGHGIAFRELRRGLEEQRHAIPFGEPIMDWPVAVLLDGGTASAAEMVAAAIRDYERGILIGQRTFGKGSVQGVYQLSDGSSVHITTSQWLSAGGYPIEGVGLEPDIIVSSADIAQDEDPFLRLAVDYLRRELGRISTGNIAPIDSYDSGKVMV